MDPILDKARQGQNLLERIANAIPGFRGYREKELRRDADKLQREQLAARLDACKRPLDGLAAAATRGGDLGVINDIETARKRLDKVTNRIRYADRGYAGFFDAVKVKEEALAHVYEFDLALLGGVDAVAEAAQAAGRSGTPADALRALVQALDALDTRLGEREEILSGIR